MKKIMIIENSLSHLQVPKSRIIFIYHKSRIIFIYHNSSFRKEKEISGLDKPQWI